MSETIKTRRAFALQEKMEFINLNKTLSAHEIEKKYGIDRHTLRNWKKNLSKLKLIKNKRKRKRIGGGGRISISEPIESEIIKWLKIARNLEIAVNTWDIIKVAKELCPELKNKGYNALQKWSYRFIRRWGYTIRRTTHIGKKLKANCFEQMNEFFRILKEVRLKQKIIDEKDYTRIWNADETAIWLDLIRGTTIEKIGNKNVNVHTFGNEKIRISILLCVNANGDKLPPLIIAKGKEGKTVEKKYNKNINVINNKVFLKCQENSWVTKELYSFWLNNIFFSESIYKNLKGNILIIDRATSHYSDKYNDLFKKFNSNY